MAETETPREQLLIAEIEWLRHQLAEPTATLAAIRSGEVDAFVVSEKSGDKVYTLRSADPPYRLMVEGMREGAATLSPDGTILYANRRLAELVGCTPETLRGSSFREFVAPADVTALDDLLRGSNGGRGEVALRKKTGGTFSAQIAAHRFEDDQVSGFCLIVTDLTEQKLQAAVAASEEKWRAANRRKDEFLATLAHELRVPLGAIGNAVDVLNQLGPTTTELQRARDIIGRQVHHLARMVDDLLDVSRIVTGKIELAREVFDLRVIVEEILDYHRPLCEDTGRRLVVSLPEAAVPIDADPARIAQVVANLLQNAAKFTHEGGTISLSLRAHDQAAVLEVADDGVGISPEMLERVFDLFAQADGERVDATHRGLGIGLTLVRRILNLHGGTVQARSEGRDRGSCFRVSLPLAAESSKKARRGPGADANASPPPRRVLVVEDHVDTAEGLVMLLQMQGHEAVSVHDGPAALLRSEEFRPDAVLLDIGLPEMDGYEVARRIRDRLGQDVLIVALTGFGQEEDRRRSHEAGIDHHLLKPVRSDVLAQLLQSPRKPSSD